MVNDQIQNVARAVHDVGLAVWLGGQVFGNLALNPAAAEISDPSERGKVVNAGWARYSAFGYGALGAASVTYAFARLTELRGRRQSRWERILTALEDLLHVSAVGLTAATGSQGARLGSKGSDGDVPIASGDQPAPQTPPDARDAQVKVNRLGDITTFVGTALVAVHAIQSRLSYSRPPLRRALLRRSR